MMMKFSRRRLLLLRSSVSSPLYTGGAIRSISQLISPISPKVPWCCCHLSFLREKYPMNTGTLLIPRYGDRIWNQSLHSSSSEEDDFSELDSSPEGPGKHLNLITEKPRESLNWGLVKKIGSTRCFGKSLLPPKEDSPCPVLCSVDENHTEISRANKDPIHTNSNPVIIENVAPTISLYQVKQAVSEFGQILNASIRSGPSGCISCVVEFTTLESKERAVASGGIMVKSCHLPIRSLCLRENITIRINNISSDTAEPALHATCNLCGPVEGLSRRNDSSVDVVFRVKDFSAGEDIVEKLNAIWVKNRWSAEILAENPDSTVMTITAADASQIQEEAAGSQLSNLLEDIQRQYILKKVLLDDLVKLHEAVVHLQNHPTCC